MTALVEPAPAVAAPGAGRALAKAARGFYEHSLRLVLLNTVFSGVALAILVLAVYQPLAVLLLVALGPLAAALMHCAVTIVREDYLRLADAVTGVRLHWRHGLLLGVMAAAVAALAVLAIAFYAGRGVLAWPLAVLTLYVTGVFGLYQLALWPLAIGERERPLREVLRDAAFALLRRPRGFTGLGLALLLVNLIGVVAAILPFLTMTIAYSFLAAAHFALPPRPLEEE